jgi:hypothetical protein
MRADLHLLPGVPADLVVAALSKAAGQELQSGKFNSPDSSAALAANAFAWFIPRMHLLPILPGGPALTNIEAVEIEYCARFPWNRGRHPWLDAMIEMTEMSVGVESKRFEPFRDKKAAVLSDSYNQPVWGNGMRPFERMRDLLREDPRHFRHLDAAQLVKHAFGLVTDAKRKSKHAHLHYLYAEPRELAGKPIPDTKFEAHRREVGLFASEVEGAEVSFSACSYREWLGTWRGQAVEDHATNLIATFGL